MNILCVDLRWDSSFRHDQNIACELCQLLSSIQGQDNSISLTSGLKRFGWHLSFRERVSHYVGVENVRARTSSEQHNSHGHSNDCDNLDEEVDVTLQRRQGPLRLCRKRVDLSDECVVSSAYHDTVPLSIDDLHTVRVVCEKNAQTSELFFYAPSVHSFGTGDAVSGMSELLFLPRMDNLVRCVPTETFHPVATFDTRNDCKIPNGFSQHNELSHY